MQATEKSDVQASDPEPLLDKVTTASPHGDAIQYLPGLDGLRGVMALGVLSYHVRPAWFPGAPAFMDVFFLISGFLITLVLQKNIARTGTLQLVRFWKRRLQRLYPAMFAMVATYTLIAFLLLDDVGHVLKDAAETLLYVSNLTKLHNNAIPTFFGHSWSLAVEEQFYLLWPLLFLASIKARLYWKAMLGLLAVVMVAAVAWRFYLIDAGAPWSRLYYSLETRMDAFIIGGGSAFLWQAWLSRWSHRNWAHYTMCACAVGLVATLVVARPMEMDYFRWQQSAVLVLTAGTVLLLSSRRSSWIRSLLSSRALVALGLRSYGIYLWHWPLIWLLTVTTGIRGLAMLAIVLPTTIAVSALTYHYIERPVLAARRSYVR